MNIRRVPSGTTATASTYSETAFMVPAARIGRYAKALPNDLAVVLMAQSPGPIRWHSRQLINALVYQAIVD